MATVRVVEFLTLDGVMQAPGGEDEDTRDGFEHGGWGREYSDAVMMEEMGKGMGGEGAMLFGRRTYEQFASYWPNQPDEDPFAATLNRNTKYVVSTTLGEPLPWENSVLLRGVDEVARLDEDLTVLGSGVLVRALLDRGLVGQLTISIHPLLLGNGRRLFGEGARADLRLTSATPTTTGVVIATYEPR